MKDMDLLLDDEPVLVNEPIPITEDLMTEVERELEAFDAFFQLPIAQRGCGNLPLVASEKALIRTYVLARKTKRFPSALEL